jgi:hypothetical protein
LAFSEAEVTSCVESDGSSLAARMGEPRWLYGSDKAAGGYGAQVHGPAAAFAEHATTTRFTPVVRRARFEAWMALTTRRLDLARSACVLGQTDEALTAAQIGGPLGAAALEAWGHREGGMTRFPTRFERIASEIGRSRLAEDIAGIGGTTVGEVGDRTGPLASWLEARIELAAQARREVGEVFTEEQNRRDHVVLFMGRGGLPTVVDWMRSRVADPDAFLDGVEAIRGEVKAELE